MITSYEVYEADHLYTKFFICRPSMRKLKKLAPNGLKVNRRNTHKLAQEFNTSQIGFFMRVVAGYEDDMDLPLDFVAKFAAPNSRLRQHRYISYEQIARVIQWMDREYGKEKSRRKVARWYCNRYGIE